MITRVAATIAIGLSGVAISGIQSHAVDATPITALLKQGYEIKSAYAVQALENTTANTLRAGAIFDFIIMQKGESVFRCENIGAKFNNLFHCFPIFDHEKLIVERAP
jgi:hypothetical protein